MDSESGIVTDPKITVLSTCVHCKRPMGPLRVYKGRGDPELAHLKGMLCQTCTGVGRRHESLPECHWTVKHTEPYNEADAEALVQRINNPALGNSGQLRPPAPPSLQPLPGRALQPPSENERKDCGNPTCVTIKGTRTQGSRTCFEYKCKKCCQTAYNEAKKNGYARPRCIGHAQSELFSVSSSQTFPLDPNLQDLTGNNYTYSVLNSGTQATQAASSTPSPSSLLSNTSNIASPALTQFSPPSTSYTSAFTSTASSAVPNVSNQSVSGAPVGRARRLAQPLPVEWTTAIDIASQKKERLMNLKSQNQTMDEWERRKFVLYIYYKNGANPLKITHYCDTFPRFQFSAVPEFMNELNLKPNSRIDLLESNGEWNCMDLQSVVKVEKDESVVIRLRPGLLQPLEDLPGLEELQRQVSRRNKYTNKRAADELVSPLKKLPRTARAAQFPSLSTVGARTSDSTSTCAPIPIPSPTSQSVDLGSSSSQQPTEVIAPASISTSSSRAETKSVRSKSQTSQASRSQKKVFPVDYAFSYVHNGFLKMHKLINAGMKKEHAIRKVFKGIGYNRSTMWKYISTWKDADDIDKEIFLSKDDSTLFIDFLVHLNVPGGRKRRPKFHLSSSESDSSDSGSCLSPPSPSDAAPMAGNLCPYCDQPMPASPSPKLIKMQDDLKMRTVLDPLPCNPHHRKAKSFTVFATFCEQHQFETVHLPAAEAGCWPQAIDFDKLYDRLIENREELNEILQEPEDSIFFTSLKDQFTPHPDGTYQHPKNDYDIFQDRGAGYYGEEGYQIILITLRHMFPKHTFNPIPFTPVPWSGVIRDFLLPEAAILLIQEDLKLDDRDACIKTLHESRQFGNIMHSSDEESDALLNVLRKTSANFQATEALYERWVSDRLYEDGNVLFIDWVDQELESDRNKAQVVKKECIDPELFTTSPQEGRSANQGERTVIDLTLDSDEEERELKADAGYTGIQLNERLQEGDGDERIVFKVEPESVPDHVLIRDSAGGVIDLTMDSDDD